MSEKITWKCYETVGIGIINPRVLTARLKGWSRVYVEILKYKMAVEVVDIKEDGTYVIETRKVGSSYWSTRHILEPGKEAKQEHL